MNVITRASPDKWWFVCDVNELNDTRKVVCFSYFCMAASRDGFALLW